MINVTLIGFGNVGSKLALLLLNNTTPLQLNIIDINKKNEGAFLDLQHSIVLNPNKKLYINNDNLFTDADFIFYTAGTPNIAGHSRLSTDKQNIELTKNIFLNKKFKKSTFIIVITNPVDIISYAVFKFSGLSPKNIIGTGTFLDSIRFKYYLSQQTKLSTEKISMMIVGEHGDSQIPILSNAKIDNNEISTYSKISLDDIYNIQKQTLNAASEIRKTQIGTSYGVSKCAEYIFKTILNKEEFILPISTLTNQYYRSLLNLKKDIFISAPVKIKNGKIDIIKDFSFEKSELLKYQKSAKIIYETIEKNNLF